MALVSISEASKLVGKSRRTLHNYISQGKLSKTIDSHGNPKIDTSELFRVFDTPNNGEKFTVKNNDFLQSFIQDSLKNSHEKDIELAKLKKEVELLRELIEEKDKRNNDLKQSLLLLENQKIYMRNNEKNIENNTVKKKWWQLFK